MQFRSSSAGYTTALQITSRALGRAGAKTKALCTGGWERRERGIDPCLRARASVNQPRLHNRLGVSVRICACDIHVGRRRRRIPRRKGSLVGEIITRIRACGVCMYMMCVCVYVHNNEKVKSTPEVVVLTLGDATTRGKGRERRFRGFTSKFSPYSFNLSSRPDNISPFLFLRTCTRFLSSLYLQATNLLCARANLAMQINKLTVQVWTFL